MGTVGGLRLNKNMPQRREQQILVVNRYVFNCFLKAPNVSINTSIGLQHDISTYTSPIQCFYLKNIQWN